MRLLARRTVIAAMAASALSPLCRGVGAAPIALRDRAAAKGLLFGAAVQRRQLEEDAQFAAAAAATCNVLVAENEMKWDAIEHRRGALDFAAADAIAAFAKANKQWLRGHNLIWHEALPPWLADAIGAGQGEALIERHIHDVCGHFGPDVLCWDVVNEAIEVNDGRADGLRRSLWLEHVGPDYLDLAFHAARAAAPGATLFYNDFGLEQDVAWQDRKRDRALSVLAGFRKRNIPVDGVGVQAHLNLSAPFSAEKFRAFLAAIAQMGFIIHVTELDVDDRAMAGDAAERDQAVAGLTRRFLDVALDEGNVRQILCWGLSDKYSWLNGAPARRRADGLPQRPLPFDDQWREKPMLEAIGAAMDGAKMR